MPNTLPPPLVDSIAVNPVHPDGHGNPLYTTGGPLPATVPSPSAVSPTAASPPGASRSPSRARARDPFFHRDSGTPEEAAMNQAYQAQEASYAADLERAVRRSKREEKERVRSESRGRAADGEHHERGLSRIRAAIKELVNDPFFHRPTSAESTLEAQQAEQRLIILREIAAAQASTEAGDIDRATSHSRSRSHVRSPLGSQPSSREPSQSRGKLGKIVGGLLGGSGGGHDRGAAGFGHREKEEAHHEPTVKEE
ncbi:hypothetical protein JCM8547_000008 [Rhodosporidiobolus lusitaniae]